MTFLAERGARVAEIRVAASGGCGNCGVATPTRYTDGSEMSSDLVMFSTAWTSNKRAGSAWPLACRFNSINRPIMGLVRKRAVARRSLGAYACG